MQTNHTPGPWTVSNNSVFGNHGVIKPLVADLDGRFDDDESKANAALIAAAPDLLVALQDLLNATEETYDNRHERQAALDAIDKATGGAA